MATKRSIIVSLAFLIALSFSGMAMSVEKTEENTPATPAEKPAVEQPAAAAAQQAPAKKATAKKSSKKKRSKRHHKKSSSVKTETPKEAEKK